MPRLRGATANMFMQLAVKAEELERLFVKKNNQRKFIEEFQFIFEQQVSLEKMLDGLLEKNKFKTNGGKDE